MREFHLGDWAQVTVEQFDEAELIGDAQDVVHVIEEPGPGRWPNCYFERTGRVSVVDPEELFFLCPADAGKNTPPFRRTHGN